MKGYGSRLRIHRSSFRLHRSAFIVHRSSFILSMETLVTKTHAPTARELGLEPGADTTAPTPARHVFPSGRVVTWLMPDIVAVLSFVGTLPDPYTAAAIKLLIGEGSYAPEDDPRYYLHRLEMMRGMQGIVAHGVVEPTIDLTREWGDGKGVLGRRDLSWADWEYAYQVLFRLGDARAPIAAPDPDEPGGAAIPAPDRE